MAYLERSSIDGLELARGDVLELADQAFWPAAVCGSLEEPALPVVRDDLALVLHRFQNHAAPRSRLSAALATHGDSGIAVAAGTGIAATKPAAAAVTAAIAHGAPFLMSPPSATSQS